MIIIKYISSIFFDFIFSNFISHLLIYKKYKNVEPTIKLNKKETGKKKSNCCAGGKSNKKKKKKDKSKNNPENQKE